MARSILLLLTALLPMIQAGPGKPNLISDNEKRTFDQGRLVGSQVQTPVRVLDIADTGNANVVRENGRLRVEVKADANGFTPDRFTAVKGVPITPKIAADVLNVTELDGFRPKGVITSFKPTLAPALDGPIGRAGGDRGGSIFGADDRTFFKDTKFPWGTTGKFRVQGGYCSGTMVGPRHVLTASHCIRWNSDGTIGWATFTPGYYDGSGYVGEVTVTNTLYWAKAPSSLTDQQTAFDYVVCILNQDLSANVGYVGYRTYDAAWNNGAYFEYIGYPAEKSGGERPMYQKSCSITSKADFTLNGQSGSVLGHFNEFTPGQSGGSAWGWWGTETFPRVVGVGSTIGDTIVQGTRNTNTDNEYGGGAALSALIAYARDNYK